MNDMTLKDILLMPIVPREESGYVIMDGIVYSGMTYGGCFDADMSDVAIDFYSIIYGVSREKIVLPEYRELKGDTMNSKLRYFKLDVRTKQEWEHKGHCLANMWLLPMDLGRTPPKHLNEVEKLYCKHSTIGKIHDYMDVFLEKVISNQLYYYEKYPNYFKCIGVDIDDFEKDFVKVHFLDPAYYENREVRLVDKKKLQEEEYREWYDRLTTRAKIIAKDERAELLLETFSEHRE